MRKRVNAAQKVQKVDSVETIKERKLLKVVSKPPEVEPYIVTREDAINVYQGVVERFKSNDQHQIQYGREEESKQINEFIQGCIEADSSGLLYLCGHPGTGKTTLLNQILMGIEGEDLIQVKLNAMSFQDFPTLLKEIVRSILSHLSPQKQKRGSKDSIEELTIFFENSLTKINHLILVIDEVDAFRDNHQSQAAFNRFLKQILNCEKSSERRCGVTVIGIANSIELFKGELIVIFILKIILLYIS